MNSAWNLKENTFQQNAGLLQVLNRGAVFPCSKSMGWEVNFRRGGGEGSVGETNRVGKENSAIDPWRQPSSRCYGSQMITWWHSIEGR